MNERAHYPCRMHARARSLRVQRLCLSGRHVSRELIRGQFRGRRRKKSPKAKEIFPDRRCSDICTNQSRKLDTLTTRCRGGPLPLASSDRLLCLWRSRRLTENEQTRTVVKPTIRGLIASSKPNWRLRRPRGRPPRPQRKICTRCRAERGFRSRSQSQSSPLK